jgi:hypothetical protein
MPDLVIKWQGKPYRVKENDLFDLTDKLEEAVSLPRLIAYLGSGEPNFSALSRSVRVLLEYAGVQDLPSLMELRQIIAGEALQRVKAQTEGREFIETEAMDAIAAVVKMVMPPEGLVQSSDGESVKKTTPHSSKASTRLRSTNGASRRATSGK